MARQYAPEAEETSGFPPSVERAWTACRVKRRAASADGDKVDIRLSEVISALSYALDVTEGQPMGHAVRSCAIGMRIGEEIGLDDQTSARRCSTRCCSRTPAARATPPSCSALFGADDFELKRARKLTNHLRPFEALQYTACATPAPAGSPRSPAAAPRAPAR